MLQRILKPSGKGSADRLVGSASLEDKDPQAVPNVEDDQPLNPFTEIQILTEHTDILKFLIQIDEQRCCTGGDDHLIIIWDVHFGKRLHVLDGHTRPLTCLSMCQSSNSKPPVLLSAASDKSICIWHVDTGHLLRSVTDHGCTARAFGIFVEETSLFCSGGENLCLWQISGDLVHKVSRSEDEDIQQILVLNKTTIVTAADKVLAVYLLQETDQLSDTAKAKDSLKLERQLISHTDSVTAVLKIDDTCFASGSLDGTIILWSSNDFTRIKFLSLKRRDYQGSDRLYPYSVQHLLCVDQRFLVCAMGSGFYIQDIVTETRLTEVWNAHYSKILHMTFMFGGLMLATCSEDGSVRLWGNPASFKQVSTNMDADSSQDSLIGDTEIVSAMDKFLAYDSKEGPGSESVCKVQVLGECLGHTGAVQKCINLGAEGFVSCGKDGVVIVWKDGLRQEMRRNEIIRDLLYGASADFT